MEATHGYDRAMLRGFGARDVGPATIGVLVGAEAVLWAVERPSGEPTGGYVGQLLGAESILLLSIGLVLISMLPWVEEWFDGIDCAAIWHRRVAIAGLVLLAPHVLLASSPDGTALGGALGAIGAVGLVALAAWAILPRWRALTPAGLRGLAVALADAPGARHVRLVFGGYERWRALHRTTGLFVAAGFLHGLLDGSPFGASQVLRWSYVATGGVGLAFYVYRELFARFFLSLHDYQVVAVREVEGGLVEIAMRPLGRRIAFVPGQFAMVYLEAKDGWHRHPFADGAAPFAGEIAEIAERHGSLHAHLIDTSADGRLTPQRVLAAVGGDVSRLTVFMCGPLAMVRAFETDLRRAGVPARRIHREHFDWR
jgi:predicted ferric reductase